MSYNTPPGANQYTGGLSPYVKNHPEFPECSYCGEKPYRTLNDQICDDCYNGFLEDFKKHGLVDIEIYQIWKRSELIKDQITWSESDKFKNYDFSKFPIYVFNQNTNEVEETFIGIKKAIDYALEIRKEGP